MGNLIHNYMLYIISFVKASFLFCTKKVVCGYMWCTHSICLHCYKKELLSKVHIYGWLDKYKYDLI